MRACAFCAVQRIDYLHMNMYFRSDTHRRFGCFILVTKYHMCTSSAHPRVSESVTTRVQKYSLTAISHFAHRVGRSFSREDRQVALFVLNVRRCDDTRTPHLIAHGINRGRSGAFLHDAPRALLHLQREHTCVLPSSLSRLWFFPACLSAVTRRRRPVRFPPPHPRALHCRVTAQS